jgi:hypothetical protein
VITLTEESFKIGNSLLRAHHEGMSKLERRGRRNLLFGNISLLLLLLLIGPAGTPPIALQPSRPFVR